MFVARGGGIIWPCLRAQKLQPAERVKGKTRNKAERSALRDGTEP